jgi:hypothetical protein
MVDSSERSHSGTSPIPSLLSAMLRASDGILEFVRSRHSSATPRGQSFSTTIMPSQSGAERQVPGRHTNN